MSILPTWPIAAGALVIGLAVGAYADHKIMQSRIDKITIAHTEELRVREVKRADDERAARTREQLQAQQVNQIQQEHIDEVSKVRSAADALVERMRKQASAKPASTSPVSNACPSSQVSAGGAVPSGIGENLVRLAERADEQRSALSACYQAYNSIER